MSQEKINAAVAKLHSEIANAKAREPIANHEANKAKLVALFKAESEKGWEEVFGKEVLDRCLAAFDDSALRSWSARGRYGRLRRSGFDFPARDATCWIWRLIPRGSCGTHRKVAIRGRSRSTLSGPGWWAGPGGRRWTFRASSRSHRIGPKYSAG